MILMISKAICNLFRWKKTLVFIALTVFVCNIQADTVRTVWRFDFGSGSLADGYVRVEPVDVFMPGREYGFLDNAGLTVIDRSQGNSLDSDFCVSEKPYYFTLVVPFEGNYRVRVFLGDRQGISRTTVKAESRRLMIHNVETAPGEIVSREFIVNVRNDSLPEGGKVKLKGREAGVWHWDNQLTIEFNGSRPCLCGMEIVYEPNLPTIFLAGDSTVTDQPEEPWTSWGQILTVMLKPDIAVANYAESGETLAGFTAEKRFEKIFSQMKAGDYLFIQFAHNDMKQGTPVQIGYQNALDSLIRQTRNKGAYPVLVTSMHRRSFDSNGKVKDTMQGFPEAMKGVAEKAGVPLIDLNAMSRDFYEAMGPDGSAVAFQDGTHHNAYGAYELARCVVSGINQNIPQLKPHLLTSFDTFSPFHPDDPATVSIPASSKSTASKPDGD